MKTEDYLTQEQIEKKPAGLVISRGNWRYKKRINGPHKSKSIGPVSKISFDQAVNAFHKIDDFFTHQVSEPKEFFNELWDTEIHTLLDSGNNWLAIMFRKARYRATKSGREFTLTFEQLKELMLKTDGRCALTDIPFSNINKNRSRVAPFRPSIDRIDSSKGYTNENCRIICAAVNLALMDFGEDVFETLAVAYLANNLRKKYLTKIVGSISGGIYNK